MNDTPKPSHKLGLLVLTPTWPPCSLTKPTQRVILLELLHLSTSHHHRRLLSFAAHPPSFTRLGGFEGLACIFT